MTGFVWAIIGPGRIAHRFADAVHRLPSACLRAVLGRDPGSTARFVEHWSRPGKPDPVAAPDLASLLADEAIDGVYIATAHSSHAGFARECLLAGKAVLCEKPLAPNLALAGGLAALSQARRVFLMEAFWTRLLPIYGHVGRWLADGAIGHVRAIQSSFFGTVPFDPAARHFAPALAGGALLDELRRQLGVHYPFE